MVMDFNDTITLKEAIKLLDTGVLCNLAFITSDKKRDTGGEWIVVVDCKKHIFLSLKNQKKMEDVQPISSGVFKNPNHYQNSTRNIKLKNGDIRKIHLRLIRRFNNKIVL
jgi:hypothetical protein